MPVTAPRRVIRLMTRAVALLTYLSTGWRMRWRFRCVLMLWLLFAGSPILAGYSMLTHEEIVDLAWADQIEPLLKQRFPLATAAELKRMPTPMAVASSRIWAITHSAVRTSAICCTTSEVETSWWRYCETLTTSTGMHSRWVPWPTTFRMSKATPRSIVQWRCPIQSLNESTGRL